jgi:putative transposase
VGPVAQRTEELIHQTATERGWEIVALEVMPDHIHVFVRCGAADSPAVVAQAFKGRTSRVLRSEFAHLSRRKALWSKSYFCASVGYVWESTVRHYIEHQWDAAA